MHHFSVLTCNLILVVEGKVTKFLRFLDFLPLEEQLDVPLDGIHPYSPELENPGRTFNTHTRQGLKRDWVKFSGFLCTRLERHCCQRLRLGGPFINRIIRLIAASGYSHFFCFSLVCYVSDISDVFLNGWEWAFGNLKAMSYTLIFSLMATVLRQTVYGLLYEISGGIDIFLECVFSIIYPHNIFTIFPH